jgi:thiosulfate/3-mercaptopyruvate sulfurtransferase
MPLPPIVDATWLQAHHGEVAVADVRWYLDGRSGHAAFTAGHIPGAVFVDLDRDLTAHGHPTAGRHPLPSPEQFAACMGALGIGDDDAVVAYDDSGGGTAGRLVWMLRAIGHDAALLDGGLASWPSRTSIGIGTPRPPTTFTPVPWPADLLVDADTIGKLAAIGPDVVIDARAADRFRGEHEPVDPRPGHIPGARNVPWGSLLDPATGRFRSREDLKATFAAAGVGADRPVVAYCGSGVSACADLLALEHAGLGPGRLFVASWSGWSSDPERPAATGDA